MPKHRNDGIIFNFENSFFHSVESYDFIDVWQIGEISVEPGYEIQEHTQLCHEITYIISGSGTFYGGEERAALIPGDIHVISKGMKHRIVSDSGTNLRFANIGFEFNGAVEESLKPLVELFSDGSNRCLHDPGELRLLMTMLINNMYSKAVYNRMMVGCFLKQILIHVYRLAVADHGDSFLLGAKEERSGLSVYNIIHYVDKNLCEFPGIEDVAKALGYSRSYISHMFKEEMGVTLQEYLCRKKIEATLELLLNQKYTVTQIAMMLNYSSIQAFSKAFRRIMGCSPTEYQLCHGKDTKDNDQKATNEPD